MARMGFHESRGSARELGDSVERLEECSGARACTFGEQGARCVWLECTGGARARGARSWRAGARGAPDFASGWMRGCARGRAARRACARLDARACGYECTIHPRARSSPKMRKST
ncbi:hypothetical protein CRG98_030177 [Punica granatum]|uniref:Uncharacterized protein n=1 Tax=Punica granatum TaxID=22663 RepID=A0A2I0IZN6_PUNGR|nr:hypothetical protein CRG98_030177 [Punica granatum]